MMKYNKQNTHVSGTASTNHTIYIATLYLIQKKIEGRQYLG